MRRKFGRRLQDRERYGYDFATEFQVESYLTTRATSSPEVRRQHLPLHNEGD